MIAALREPQVHSVPELASPAIQRRVNALRATDNVTNWFYLARECLLLGLVVTLAIYFYQSREAWDLAWAWNVPVTLLAVVLVGAGQHRLTTLAHEASHYMLFRNRVLNELVSDWFCMFPMWSTTHSYRLQHLAHHQYVNDPVRDPDITQMQASGHRFHFPMSRGRFVWECVVKQFLWLPNLVRYIRVRARYAATPFAGGPYRVLDGNRSKLLTAAGIVYLLVQVATLPLLVLLGHPWILALVPLTLWAGMVTFFLSVPKGYYRKSLVKPDVHARWTSVGRVTYATALFMTLAWLTYRTGDPWALYYFFLWVVPIGTTFSFFMIMRQVVQHGNASEDRLTNTRIFHVGRLIQLAVFPLGMDYHLPHHMFPMVPHFRLRQLHDLLSETEAYQHQATLVDGYFFHKERPPVHPTVVELMAQPPRSSEESAV